MNVELIKEDLSIYGFNLFAVVDFPPDDDATTKADGSVLLIGNAGNSLWDNLSAEYLQRADPIDEYTVATVGHVMRERAGECDWQFLFPGNAAVNEVPNLQRLGAAAGWHHNSPLGIGINERYGLWFGYRAVVRIGVPVSASSGSASSGSAVSSPCLTCEEKACLQACPANALSASEPPNLTACSKWRVQEQSGCASTCLARISCPVAVEWRYSDAQIAYYYERSLPSLLRWTEEGAE
ncbi:hypothetical protein AB833_29915 [Chromatiales bacterium (ex Bugula neritina AB1)]|nr:hypothetical protein AB833_29915 [Chromatiales bacterium (ex Bugula neritina AB1)]